MWHWHVFFFLLLGSSSDQCGTMTLCWLCSVGHQCYVISEWSVVLFYSLGFARVATVDVLNYYGMYANGLKCPWTGVFKYVWKVISLVVWKYINIYLFKKWTSGISIAQNHVFPLSEQPTRFQSSPKRSFWLCRLLSHLNNCWSNVFI